MQTNFLYMLPVIYYNELHIVKHNARMYSYSRSQHKYQINLLTLMKSSVTHLSKI